MPSRSSVGGGIPNFLEAECSLYQVVGIRRHEGVREYGAVVLEKQTYVLGILLRACVTVGGDEEIFSEPVLG